MRWSEFEATEPRLAALGQKRLIEPGVVAADLRRDPRVLVHSIVTGRSGEDGEYKVRGRAIEDPSRHEFVRRGTSATSLGEPEPYRDLLVE